MFWVSFPLFTAPLQEKKERKKAPPHHDRNSEFKIIKQREFFFKCASFFIFTQVKMSGMRKTKQYGEQKGYIFRHFEGLKPKAIAMVDYSE